MTDDYLRLESYRMRSERGDSAAEPGDYVLGTSYWDGDAHDPWFVGFFDGGNNVKGFRILNQDGALITQAHISRCELITQDVGSKLLDGTTYVGKYLWDFVEESRKKLRSQ